MEKQDNKPVDFLILESQIVQVLKTVYDPEIPVDIYSLGLIYEVEVDENANAHVVMTLTTPNCPVAESLPAEVKEKNQSYSGYKRSGFGAYFRTHMG